ncbi:MAG: alkaline phosphatase family protein [Gemmataceae bacterium]
MSRLVSLVTLLMCSSSMFADAPASDKRILPGIQPSGMIKLPNTWSIQPAGNQIEVGDLPVNSALHPNGRWLAVLHAGYGDHEIITIDVKAKKPYRQNRVNLKATFYGLRFSRDGKTLYASGGEFEVIHAFDFKNGILSNPRQFQVSEKKFIVGGVDIDPKGKLLFATGVWGHAVCILPNTRPQDKVLISLGNESYPYTCLCDSKGKYLYVSLWNKAQVAVVDIAKKKVIRTLQTERHPTEMILGPEDNTLFVACSNSTKVSVIELKNGKNLETIACALYPNAPSGNTPNSLDLTPDGQILFVANADANNVAVFNVAKPGKSRPLGFIPVGMYPTSVRYNPKAKKIYVVNGRGTTPKANPKGPNPNLKKNQTIREYIARLYRGTVSIIDMPDEEKMVAFTKTAYKCSPLQKNSKVVGPIPKNSPIPAKLGDPSPIKYCIYVIRENRTYDQVFGDIQRGNGDPDLCLFPKKITPNAHRLADQFVLLDNFYVEGEVSADGHEWSMGAYATDFVKRVWPLSYRGSPTKKMSIYPSEGIFDSIARPAGGYIWDRCAEAKVSYRSYGEWVKNGKTPNDPATAMVKALEGHIDPKFRSYDLDYPDVNRAKRFISELKRFEKQGGMPQLSIVRLPNDHTYGTRPGKPTPTAMVAENDLALGLLVEAVSKSKFWKETAIFVVEDDAQNGSDHVDAHRTVALVISPYTQHGKLDSTMYSTASMLRTMELILGLKPMSQFDAAARPMYNAFQAKPTFRTYTHVVPDTDMKALNKKTAWGAKLSEKFDLTKEDAADDLLFNEVIWRSVKGPDSPMPAPVRAAFVFPHSDDDDDDDDGPERKKEIERPMEKK